MSKATDLLAPVQAASVEHRDAGLELQAITKPLGGEVKTPQKGKDGKAKFGGADALAAGVLGTFLLGPVGGILMGGAAGWATKNARQNILDTEAAKSDVVKGNNAVYTKQLDTMESSAGNDGDLDTIGKFRMSLEASQALMLSPDSEQQARGANMRAGLDADMTQYQNTQEAQAIAERVRNAQIARELDNEQHSRFTQYEGNYTSESGDWERVQDARNVVIEALRSGSATGYHAAIVSFNKVLDPDSAVLPAEAAALGNIGSWGDKLNTFLNSAENGQTMNVKQRNDMMETVNLIADESNTQQQKREVRYSGLVSDAGLPLKFHDNFMKLDQRGAIDRTPIPADPNEPIQASGGGNAPVTSSDVANSVGATLLGAAKDVIGFSPAVILGKEILNSMRPTN